MYMTKVREYKSNGKQRASNLLGVGCVEGGGGKNVTYNMDTRLPKPCINGCNVNRPAHSTEIHSRRQPQHDNGEPID